MSSIVRRLRRLAPAAMRLPLRSVALAPLVVTAIATSAPTVASAQEAGYATATSREVVVAGAVGSLLLLREWLLDTPTVGPNDFDRAWEGSSFDEPATRYSSEGWRAWTDRLVLGLWVGALASAALPPSSREGERRARLVSLAETGLLTLGTTEVIKMAVGRHRPYTYNATLPDERIEYLVGSDSTDARASFPSGHASMAFAAATFSASVLTTTHDWPAAGDALVWGVTLGAAASTAVGRVRAGKHFPTDVIVGAALGAAFGLLTPSCHEVGDGFCDLQQAEAGPTPLQISLLTVPIG